MADLIRRKQPGEAWETAIDTGGGGGSQPIWAAYEGDSIIIGNNDLSPLPFSDLVGGVELLDRTPPFNLILADGVYSLTVWAQGDALTAGGYASCQVQVGIFETGIEAFHPENGVFGATTVGFCAAGNTVAAYILNKDGVAARNFNLVSASLVKLS